MQKQNVVTGILLVVTGIFVASNIYSLIPLYRDIAIYLEIGERAVSYGSVFFTLFYAFGLLLYGPLSDRFGRKQTMLTGLFMSVVTSYLVATSEDPARLYLFRSLQGFTLASFAPVAFLYAFDLFKEKERTLWISLINAGFLAAGILGQLFSSFIGRLFGWESVYVFFSILYGAILLLGLVLFPNTKRAKRRENWAEIWHQYKTIGKTTRLIGYYTIVITLLFSFVAFYEAVSYSFSSEETIHLIRFTGLIGTGLSLFTGHLLSISEKYTLLCGISLGWFSLFFLLFAKSPAVVSLLGIFFVAAISVLIPTVIHLIGSVHSRLRGKALSLYSFLLLIGASFGSLLAASFPYQIVLTVLLLLFTGNIFIGMKEPSSKKTVSESH